VAAVAVSMTAKSRMMEFLFIALCVVVGFL